jgi:arsenate reductase-like glutaredoxin family protein
MNQNHAKKEVLHEVIIAYRNVIKKRYNFENITEIYEIPDSFNEERVDIFRAYFLNHIYPPPEKRDELDDAFNSLDNYIKHPEKLLRILIDSGSLLFKYGRHLPKILKAGIKALKSFRAANNFENKLIQTAMHMELATPYDSDDINTFISSLSIADINEFIENNEALFETLHDRTLIIKILEIVEHLILKMKKRPKIYSTQEIRGLEIGRDIIKEGNALFDQLSIEEQEQVFEFVLAIERDHLEELFNS